MASAYKQAEDMYALQDYIDAQFGGPGKGFLRIVKSPTEARKVINDGKLAMVLGVEVSEVLDCGQFNDIPKCTPDADRRRARQARVGRRAVAVPDPQVRQRARRHEVRLRRDRRARQHRQQVRHRASSGPPSTATTPTTTTSPPTRPASTPRPDLHAVRPGAHAAAVRRGSCRSIRPAPLCNPQGPDPARRVPDPVDDAPRA